MGAPARPLENIPRALTIAGSDSGGGAGIQADLKTFFALGCHGMSAVTALTAQNTVGVHGIFPVEPGFVVEQIRAVAGDIGIDAAKTGMLASAAIVEAVADAIVEFGLTKLVVDPVFVSKHGDTLLTSDSVEAMRRALFPLAEVITPNLYEAAALVGRDQVTTRSEMVEAAKELHDLGPRYVLVKGGHLGDDQAVDVLYDGLEMTELEGPRYETQDTHGTGCTLSAAIAAHLARGDDTQTAIGAAKQFITGAIERPLRIGKGVGPVNPGWNLFR